MNSKIEKEIKDAGRNAGKKFWQYMKSKKKKRTKQPLKIENSQGEEKSDEEGIKNCILEHMTTEQDRIKSKSTSDLPRGKEELEREWDETILTERISREELSKAIKCMKKGKASGLDNIPNEMIKNLGTTTQEVLLDIFNEILLRNAIPKDWKSTRVRLLHKGKGKATNKLNAYRPIAVANSLYTNCIWQY